MSTPKRKVIVIEILSFLSNATLSEVVRECLRPLDVAQIQVNDVTPRPKPKAKKR